MEEDKPKQLLLVDNSPVILKLLSHTLERQGYLVKTAGDGLAALQVLENLRPDVIITDLIMPKIGGDLLCRIIRSRPEFDEVLLVVLTAVAAEEQLDYVALGADACVAKGPAKVTCDHILSLVQRTRKNCSVESGVIGLEGVNKREITSELLSAKHHFEVTLEFMTDGFVELTTSGKILYVNNRTAEFFQQAKEFLISSDFVSHFHREFRSRLNKCLKRLADDPLEIGEDELIELQGARVLLKFVRVTEPNQQSIIVVIRDISKRKHLESQIRDHLHNLEQNITLRTKEYLKINAVLQEEIREYATINEDLAVRIQQLEAVFEASDQLVAILDEEMRIVRVNNAMAARYDRAAKAFVGLNASVLSDADIKDPGLQVHMIAATENRKVSRLIPNFYRQRSMHVTSGPINDERGLRCGYVLMLRDPNPSNGENSENL
jgi:PAS domain S-box-containing protein